MFVSARVTSCVSILSYPCLCGPPTTLSLRFLTLFVIHEADASSCEPMLLRLNETRPGRGSDVDCVSEGWKSKSATSRCFCVFLRKRMTYADPISSTTRPRTTKAVGTTSAADGVSSVERETKIWSV